MRGLLIASLLAATPAYADVFEKGFLERLDEGVELKDSQRGKIKRLLDKEKKGRERDVERLEELEKKVDQLRQKLGREEHKTREKVRDMLSLEQKERFDEIIHHMRQRDRRRHEGLPWEDGPEMPAEIWHEMPLRPRRQGLPPEIIEYIERRRQEGARPVPPPEDWNDRNPGLFNEPPTPPRR